MRVCILVGSLSGGGAERVASILANGLLNRFEIHLVTMKKETNEYYTDNNIHRYVLKQDINFFNRIFEVRKLINTINAEVYVSFDIYFNILMGLVKLTKRIKLIMSERNDPFNVKISPVTKTLRNICYNFADSIVFQTIEAQSYFNNKIKDNGVVILNPIKPNLPTRIKNKSKVIVAVGRLTEQKNYPLLLNGFKDFSSLHTDFRLEIYGEGELEREIKELVKNLDLEGKVSLNAFNNNIHEIIKSYQIYVLTSNYEGMPNSLIEAMGMGFPVIASDTPSGGTRCIIKNKENGLLFKPGDQEGFTRCLEKLALDEELQNKISNNALGIKEKLSEKNILSDWIILIERVIL